MFLDFRLIFTAAVFGFISGPTVLSNAIDSTEPHRSKRAISNGVKSKIEEFPYAVQLEFVNSEPAFLCGGSIIKPRYILTAAHCLMHSRNPSMYRIWVGSSHLLKNEARSEVHNVANISVYPRYYANNDYGDLAILRLDSSIDFDFKTKRPIDMFDSGETIKPGTVTVVAGWGYDQENGALSQQLMKVQLKVVGKEECNATYKSHGYSHLGDGIFCATGGEKLKSICAGDSGGPLVMDGKLVGVSTSSDSEGCFSWPLPNIFTEVSHFRKWIDDSVLELGQGGSTKEQAKKKIITVKKLIIKARLTPKPVALPQNWAENVQPKVYETEETLRDMFDNNFKTKCGGILDKSKSIFKQELQSYIQEKLDEQMAADEKTLDLTDTECRNITQRIKQCSNSERDSGKNSCDWIKIEAQADRMQKLLEDMSKTRVSDLVESIIDEKKGLVSSMIRKHIISSVANCMDNR